MHKTIVLFAFALASSLPVPAAAVSFRLAVEPGLVTLGTTDETQQVAVGGDLYFDVDLGTVLVLGPGGGRLTLGDAVLLGPDHAGLFDVEAALSGSAAALTPGHVFDDWVLTLVAGEIQGCCNPPSPAGFVRDLSTDPVAFPLPALSVSGVTVDQLFFGTASFVLPLDLQVGIPELAPDLRLEGELVFRVLPIPEPTTASLLALGLLFVAIRTRPRLRA